MPFVLAALAVGHLIALHQEGSGNPLGINSRLDRVSFHPYYSLKDSYGIIMALVLLTVLVYFYQNM